MDENCNAPFTCGTLWKRIRDRSNLALQCGALKSIPTDCRFVHQNKIAFVIRILTNLARKDEEKKKLLQGGYNQKNTNPFLPCDRELFVANISPTHVGLLNKFNVVENHLLIVTREFEEQERLLTLRDFEAMYSCLAEFPGLAFYNGGQEAGASQPHKHLQMVPLPLSMKAQVPIEPLINSCNPGEGKIFALPGLPFLNAFVHLNTRKNPIDAAKQGDEYYRKMLAATGVKEKAPYNLLVTRQWMLLAPRSQESFQSISMNSLAFAGAFLVRNEREMQTIEKYGPMTAVKNVAKPFLSGDASF